MTKEQLLNNIENKLASTIHYQKAGKKKFKEYFESFVDNKIFNIIVDSYQPLSKNISFKLLISNKISVHINVSINTHNIFDFSFEEHNTKYDLIQLDDKKDLINTLHYLSNNIKIKEIESIFSKISIIKKEYLSLEREKKKITLDFHNEKNKKYHIAIKNYFQLKTTEDIESEINKYLKEADLMLNTKYKEHDFSKSGIYNILNNHKTFFYFEINGNQIHIKKSNIDFNITPDKKVNFKLDSNVTSRKKFSQALSNRFLLNGEYPTSIEELHQNDHIKKLMPNRYRLECDIEEFAKPLLLVTIAKNF